MQKSKSSNGVKAAVIGYGGAFNMGRAHLREMQNAGMTPVAVAEIDPARLASAELDFPGIQTYATVSEFLRKSDAEIVAIITPHNTHAKLALQCLNAGRHVIVEKPFTITTAEADDLIRTAKAKRLLVTAYHNRHWDGWILRAVEEVCRKKSIGDVYRIDLHMGQRGLPRDWWRTSRKISGGVLYDWGVHLLEYALQIVDSQAVEVAGFAHSGFWAPQTAWKADTNEDEAAAVIRFKNGAWVNLCISQLNANPEPYMVSIRGTLGSYSWNWEHYVLHRIEAGVQQVEKGAHPTHQTHKFYENIAAHLKRDVRLVIPPEWARRPIHLLELATRSAKLGRSLPADDRWPIARAPGKKSRP
jgi:predicted dehydrogenase